MKNILCSGNVSVDIKAYSAEVEKAQPVFTQLLY